MVSVSAKASSLHYDPYNQLDSVGLAGYGPPYLRFGYNSSGERVYKNYVYWRKQPCGGGIYKASDTTGTSGISGPGEPPPDTIISMCWTRKTASTYYVYGGGQVLAEYASPAVAGSPKAKYIYAGTRRIAMIDQSGNVFFYLNDHLGSARVVVNAQTGQASDYHWYYAYGAPMLESTSTNQAYKYTGKPFDDEGGFDLYYYGARYYDANLGRFISVDPLDSKYPGWSPYVYVRNNPMKRIDPSGATDVNTLASAEKVVAKVVTTAAQVVVDIVDYVDQTITATFKGGPQAGIKTPAVNATIGATVDASFSATGKVRDVSAGVSVEAELAGGKVGAGISGSLVDGTTTLSAGAQAGGVGVGGSVTHDGGSFSTNREIGFGSGVPSGGPGQGMNNFSYGISAGAVGLDVSYSPGAYNPQATPNVSMMLKNAQHLSSIGIGPMMPRQ